MSFFKKLFGRADKPSTRTNEEIIAPQEQNKPKRTIFDFFQIDLENIPDETFIKGEVETNSSGDTVQNYRKVLNYKECGIFDTIEIKIIGENGKNVFFKSFQPDSIKKDALRKLIDDLYLIHGNDSSDKGRFINKDIEDYNDREFNMLFGRRWMDSSKYKNPVTIRRDEDEVSISIWGL